MRVSDHYERVQQFMEQAGQTVRTTPATPTQQELCRIIALNFEELMEMARAAGVQITLQVGNELALEHHHNQYGFAVTGNFDLLGYADACADLSVTNVCGMVAAGIPDIPLLEEVDAANLRKFAPGGYRDANGKWRKPPGWTGPDIASAIGLGGQV